jgi:hypothetical protein
MTTALRTDAGTANIFEVRTGWGWTLGGSEGIEDSFEAAVAAAETYASEKASKNTTHTHNWDGVRGIWA